MLRGVELIQSVGCRTRRISAVWLICDDPMRFAIATWRGVRAAIAAQAFTLSRSA